MKSAMTELIEKGGPLMWVLFFTSILGIGIFLERLLFYFRSEIDVGDFLQGLSNLIRRKNYAEALHECAGAPGPAPRVIHSALVHHNAPRAELRGIVREAAQLEIPRLERKIRLLTTLAYAAPLLGLLGTVLGLIDIFDTISSHGGYVTASELASGVYGALLTSALGLGIGALFFILTNYLMAWIDSLIHDMERAGLEIINLLSESAADAEIIAFREPRLESAK